MRHRTGTLLLVSAVLTAALAAGVWFTATHRQEYLTDDSRIELPSSRALPRDILWQPPKEVDPAEIPADAIAGTASPSGDGFVFAAPGPDGDLDLFESTRTETGRWTTRRLSAVSSPDQDTTPAYSPDGSWLWFSSDRPGGVGGYDIWRAPSINGIWGEPEYLASELIQTRGDETSPALLPGSETLVFARRAASGEPSDLVFIEIDESVPKQEIAHHLNSESDDRSPSFSPAGDFLYFSSNRPGGAGGYDLYRARLSEIALAVPAWLGEEVNTEADETEPSVDTAGFRLRFRSSAAGKEGYLETTAKEVYRSIRTRWPNFGMGSELLALLPWILAALALVLFFAALRKLASHEHWQRRWGTLGLMARCVFASMAIHAMLAVLLSLWQVETGTPFQKGDEGVQVALTSRFSMNEIADQLQAPILSSRSAPADDAHPQDSRPTTGAMEEILSPAETAVAAIPTNQRDAATQLLRGMPPVPEVSHSLRESSRSLPEVSKSSEDESSSTQRSVTVTSDQVRPQVPSVRSASLQPVDTDGLKPTWSEVSEADAQIELAITTDTSPDLTHHEPSRALPVTDRNSAIEVSSRQSTTIEREIARSPIEPDQPDAIVLMTSSAIELPTATRLADASTQLDTSTEGITFEPILPLRGFDPPTTPAVDLADRGPETQTQMLVTSQVQSPEIAPTATRVMFVDPQDNEKSPSRWALSEASQIAATPESPPLSSSIHSPHATLPVFETNNEASSTNDSVASVDADFEPAPIDANPTLDIRPEFLASTALPLVNRTKDSTAEIGSNPPSLPLITRAGESPMLPLARSILGIVLNANTDEPVPDALVRLDGEANAIRIAHADQNGRFTLTPAHLPNFAVITASADGYVPIGTNIAESDVERGIWIEFRLNPASNFDIALDDEPHVHHLGNDEFTGAINSQFQVKSEGTLYTTTIVLDSTHLNSSIAGAEFRALVRGAQNQNPITVNGRQLSTAMTGSPVDGSFGVFIARIPLQLLREGENVIQIRATDRRGTDIDDFEFVNPRLVFLRLQIQRSKSF